MQAVCRLLRWPQLLKLILAGLAWPAVAFFKAAFIETPRNGPWVARNHGIPLWRQVFDQVRIATTAQMLPRDYYMFELYRPEMRNRHHEYLLRSETKAGLFQLLRIAGKRPYLFRNKLVFAEECVAAAIPHVPVLACFRGGDSIFVAPGGLPQQDLFIKPLSGRGGFGAERWNWTGTAYQSVGEGTSMTAAGLVERLRERSSAGRGEKIVQPAVANHPAYDGLANGALSTIRILSCLDENMRGRVITACARISSRPGKIVDNIHQGGIGANVDLETGALGPASDLGVNGHSIWHDTHPMTGARIKGFQIPCWAEAKALATRAHETIGDRMVIGWDMAILPDGPCLVEGNGRPCVDIVQRARRAPLGATELPEMMAFHLRRLYPAWRDKRSAGKPGKAR
jgi:hypothetical protein